MFGTAIELMKKGSQLEAQSQIQKLQEQYLGLHAENLELKQRLLDIKEKLEQREQMVFNEPYFYTENNEVKDGPYCPRCWQKDNKKCRVIKTPESYHSAEKCQVCDQGFGQGKPVPMPRVIR